MIEPGRGWGYLVLFSEIGISLLVTTLVGALAGHWVDGQLGMTFPVFMLIGFFLGAGAGTADDHQAGESVPEVIRLAGRCPTGREDPSAASSRAPVCGASVSSEQVVTPEVAETPAPQPKSRARAVLALVPAHRRGHRLQHHRADPRARRSPRRARPGDACAFPVCYIKGTLEFPAPHVVWAPRGLDAAAGQRADRVLPEHQLDDPHDVDRHGDRPDRRRS